MLYFGADWRCRPPGTKSDLGSCYHCRASTAGTDFIIAHDGRIAAIYLLFDKLP
jgi:hypothetical protein